MRRLCLFLLLISALSAQAAAPLLVLIDAGHGGKDSGGAGNGLMEKNLTLDTAKRLQTKLQRAGVKTVMLRQTDYFIDLDERVAFANRHTGRNAVLVSIHYNAVSGSSAHGTETFFWRPDATALATRIQRNLASSAQTTDLGINRRRLRLTRNPQIPAVLVECAYMTNPREARRLADARVREAIAAGIAAGILEFQKKGDSDILRVPEIASPLSRPTDPPDGGQRIRP